ncbi:MAG: tetratricopeptide repeat protein [Candidatus Cloacimonetes bacterium]|nr:tetratricopeptide repeat protein [Candidatus Cloacimonadota bacterium]
MNKSEYQAKIASSSGKEQISNLLQYSKILQQEDGRESVIQAKRALKLCREQGFLEQEIFCLFYLGYAYYYSQDFKQAEKVAEELLRISEGQENELGTGLGSFMRGDIYFKKNMPGEALEQYLQALDNYLRGNHKSYLMTVYNSIAKVYHHLKDFDEAYNYMDMALEIGIETDSPFCDTFRMNMGSIKYSEDNFEKAMELYQVAAAGYRKNNQKTALAGAVFNIGLAYGAMEKPEEQLENYLEAYRLFEELRDWNNVSKISNLIAMNLLDKGDFEGAYRHLQQSEKLADEHDYSWHKVCVLENYARYYDKLGDYKKPNEYLRDFVHKNNEYQAKINHEKIAQLNAKYKAEIYRLQNQELKASNQAMTNQIKQLNDSLGEMRGKYDQLQGEFGKAIEKLNTQGDILANQSQLSDMGEMVSLIAHQWRQPLNVIGILVQSFIEAWEYEELSEDFVREQTRITMEQIQYMSDTITDFRNFLKPQQETRFNLKNAIERAIHLAEFMLIKGEVKLESELEEGCILAGIENEIAQVVLNLVNNARQEMKSRQVLEPVIRLRMERCENEYIIQLYNSGTMLPEEVKERLFDPYFTTKGEDGTGLGLYICKMIIENKYKGTISVANVKDGVEFRILLPVTKN